MPGCVEMFGGVLVLRAVTAADVTACAAQAQVHPGVAHGEAFFAAIAVGLAGLYKVQVRASGRHENPVRV